MTTVVEALEELRVATNKIPKLRAYRGDQLGSIQLPAVVIGLPSLTWEAYCEDPTDARFPVAILVPLDNKAMDQLMAFAVPVVKAIETTGATVDPEAGLTPFSQELGNNVTAAGYELFVDYPFR